MSGITFEDKTVTYDGNEHELLIEGTLPEGVTVTYENNKLTEVRSIKATAIFTHNNPNYNEIPNMTATLTIEEEKFAITWKNQDGTILEIDENVIAGDMPEYNGNIPTMLDPAGLYTYTFIGWSPNVSAVFNDTVYTAIYDKQEIYSFVLNKEKTGYIITDYKGDFNDLILPGHINGLPVVELGEKSFANSDICNITIPDTVSKISSKAFFQCFDLKNINFGENSLLSKIETYAFYNCFNLMSIMIPSNISMIDDYAFYNCLRLYEVTFSDDSKLNKLNMSVFGNCHSLEKITIPNSVTIIEQNAFSNCYNLQSITIPDSVKTVSDGAFSYCESLMSCVIPNETVSIGFMAFDSCSKLVVYSKTNGISPTMMPDRNDLQNSVPFAAIVLNYIGIEGITDDGIRYALCVDENDKYCITITDYLGNSKILEIPDSISVTINNKEIIVPVTNIADYAISECLSLVKVVIPNSVTTIGKFTFLNCLNLSSITIPSSVVEFKENPFNYISDHIISKIDVVLFCEMDSKPSGWDETVDNYRTIWNYGGITGTTNEGLIWALCNDDNKNSYISIFDYIGEEKLTIPSFITTTINGNNVDLPITTISSHAFDSTNLIEVNIPDTVTNIGRGAFMRCESLKSVSLPNGISKIDVATFSSCSSLETINIPQSITSIGRSAFRNCSSLKSIKIPNGVTSIGERAFDGCSSLDCVIIPVSVTSIGRPSGFSGEYYTFYYEGTREQWDNVDYESSYWYASVYYYSETEPITSGNYWHYDVDGITPVIWNKY